MPSCRWTPLGPSAIWEPPRPRPAGAVVGPDLRRIISSGRCTSIALHPDDPENVIFVGTALGGVWRTRDGGRSWEPRTDDQRCLAIGALAIDPRHPEVVYAGTGEGVESLAAHCGDGVLKSEDGGDSWTMIGEAELAGHRVHDLVFPTAGGPLFAGSTAGVFRSDDGGSSWQLLRAGHATSLALDDHDAAGALTLYAAFHREGVLRSNGEAGGTWTLLGRGNADESKNLPDPTTTAVGRIAVALSRARPARLFAAYSDRTSRALVGLFTSENAGADWAKNDNPLAGDQTEYDLALAVSPSDPDLVFFGTDLLYRSWNGGLDFFPTGSERDELPAIHADQHRIAFDPKTPTTVWVCNDGGVFVARDEGQDRWVHRNRGLGAHQLYAVSSHPAFRGILVGGTQDNGLVVCAAHPAWERKSHPQRGDAKLGDASYASIDRARPAVWYASGNNHASRTRDSGKTWRKDDFDDDVRGFFPPIVVAGPGVAYLGTEHLYRTDGDAEAWDRVDAYDHVAPQDGDVIVALGARAGDPEVLYAATAKGRLFRVERGAGRPATVLAAASTPWVPLPDVVNVSAIAVHPANADTLFVALGEADGRPPAPAAPRLWRSRNAGAGWDDLTGRLPIPDWIPAGGRPPRAATNNPVHCVVIDPDAPGHVYVGCDLGVFRSTDGGDHWVRLHHGLPNSAVFGLALEPRSRSLRAATYGRGVWERSLDEPPCTEPPGSLAEAALLVRDHALDTGWPPSELDRTNPLPGGTKLRWTDGADIKIDVARRRGGALQTAPSTIDFAAGGPIDFLGFEEILGFPPHAGEAARVYVQLHNRGPDEAADVRARVFWARLNGDLPPALPEEFPLHIEDAAIAGPWQPIGPARTVDRLRPAVPAVVQWDWDVPRDAGKNLAVLAVVSAPADRFAADSRDTQAVVRSDRHVALQRHQSAPRRWPVILAWCIVGGIAALLLGKAAIAVYRALKGGGETA
jgi:photosystem II stability/assembly factor-like uncharacterized protein